MSIVADHGADAAELVSSALTGVTWNVHGPEPVPAEAIAPPCVVIGVAHQTAQLGTLGSPEWSWAVRILAIGADTLGTGLYDVAADVSRALWAAGIRSTSEPRTWSPDKHPAGIPALEITAT